MAKEPKMKIGIGADTGDFEKGSKKVKDALKQLGIDANSAAGKMVASLGKSAVALAGVVKAIKVVGKALNELKDQNQVLADSWGRACEGMTGAFETFKSSIVSLDFSNLIVDMAEAARLAQDLYDAADAMGEITTAYNIGLAQQLGKIDELRLKMKDASLSEQERVKAGQDLLGIYEQLEKNPTRGLGRVSDATIDYYMQRMGVNMEGRTDAQLKAMRKKYLEFFKWLATEQGENFLSAAETIAKSGGLDSYWGKTALANARNAGLEENLRLAYAYSTKMGDEDREKLEKAVVSYLQQENKFSQETFKIRTQIQQIQNEGDVAAAKAASDAAARAKSAQDAAAAAKEEADAIARIQAIRDAGGVVGVSLDLPKRVEVEVEPKVDAGAVTSAIPDSIPVEVTPAIKTSAIDTAVNSFLYGWTKQVGDIQKTIAEANRVSLSIPTTIVPPKKEEVDTAKAHIVAELGESITLAIKVDPDSVEKIHDITSGVTNSVQNMALSVGEAFGTLAADLATGENAWGNFSNAAISAFGDMAIAVGKIAIETGLASEGIKAALELDNPYIAIAAGIALVGLGAAVKAGLSNISAGNYSASSGVATSASSSFNSDYEQRDVYVNVEGVLRADGDELLAIINTTQKKNLVTT